MAPNRIWTYANNEVSDYKLPSGKGKCYIMSHLGSAETGLQDGCLMMFPGGKSQQSEDYHTKMNSAMFLDWLEKTVFPKLKEGGKKYVLVLDKATYHSPLTENTRSPNMKWTKRGLVAAIIPGVDLFDIGPLIGGHRKHHQKHTDRSCDKHRTPPKIHGAGSG